MTFIPYQVDYSVKNTAKTLGFSKKRVSFKFGFANPSSIGQGNTGAQCRGSEHEVTFLWSLASGKRQLFLDGKDVHSSESGMNGWTSDRAWQHSFPLRELASGVTYKVHFISQPVNKDIPDMKAFDLRINGVSYFNFNEIWKLGTPAMVTRQGPKGHGDASGSQRPVSPMTAEERRLIALAKVESLKELERLKAQTAQMPQEQQQPIKQMVKEEQSLISFDDPPAPAPHQHYQSTPSIGSAPQQSIGQQPHYSPYASSMTMGSDYGMPLQQQPPQPHNPYGAPPPVPHYSPYGAPPPGDASAGGSSSALTPFTAGPAPSPYGMPPPPAPVQTYGYAPTTNAPGFDSLTSPSGHSYASYGSAPSFARPPPPPAAAPVNPYGAPGYAGYPSPQQSAGSVGGGGYPPAYPQQQQQQQQQQYPPQQQQQYSQQPYGYPNQPAY